MFKITPITKVTLKQQINFLKKINKTSTGCFEWTGSTSPSGYGRVFVNGTALRAHRVAYFIANGSIDENLTIDHLCFNKKCVNPKHLEQVTLEENIARRDAKVK